MKKKVITLCGELGAGKSTTTALLKDKLGYEHIYTGKLHRDYAEELGISFHEYHKLAEEDQKYDKEVDRKLKSFLAEGEEIICDSYLAAWFAPDAFKVFLNIDDSVAAERMFEDQKTNPNRASENYLSVEDQLSKNAARRASNVKRFNDLYQIPNYLDKEYYDLVVDTTDTPPEEVLVIIVEKYKEWLES